MGIIPYLPPSYECHHDQIRKCTTVGRLTGSVGWASAFGSGHDPRVLGWSTASGSLLSRVPALPPPLLTLALTLSLK